MIGGGMIKDNIFRIIKTLVCTYITTFIMLLLMTLLFYKVQINNNKIMIGVYITYVLSNFVGGFIFGKIAGRKKYLYGMLVGAVYFVVLLIISIIVLKGTNVFTDEFLFALIACIAGGMLGGMIS